MRQKNKFLFQKFIAISCAFISKILNDKINKLTFWNILLLILLYISDFLWSVIIY